MTPEKAIEVLERGGWWDELNPNMSDADAEPLHEALDMAIDALRARQEPVKLDRSRWEGCFTCKHKLCKTCRHSSLSAQIEPCRSCAGNHKFYDQMSFCPVCGKPLTERAWAELERRIGGNDEAD